VKHGAAAVASGATITATYSGASGGDDSVIVGAQINGYSANDVSAGSANGGGSGVSPVSSGTLNGPFAEMLVGFEFIRTQSATAPNVTPSAGFTSLFVGAFLGLASLYAGWTMDYQIVNVGASVTYNPSWNVNSGIVNTISSFV
jgi:hypothetical protein